MYFSYIVPYLLHLLWIVDQVDMETWESKDWHQNLI